MTEIASLRPARTIRRQLAGWLAIRALLGVAAIAALLPVLYLVSLSLRRNDDMLSGSWIPTVVSWANWPDAFDALPQNLGWYVANSWVVAGGAAILSLLIAVPGAVYTARAGARGERLLGIALMAYCAPPVVAMVPLFLLLRYTSLLNTLLGLVLVNGLANVSIALWLIDGFVRRVPIEIEEAAWIDGASRWLTLRRVLLPLIWPGVVATGLICLFVAYSEFLFAVSYAQTEDSQTLTVALSIFQSSGKDINYGKEAVASLVGILPMYVLAFLSQRWLVAGLTAGAVKS
jgi:multiple sugar transport system permease protein